MPEHTVGALGAGVIVGVVVIFQQNRHAVDRPVANTTVAGVEGIQRLGLFDRQRINRQYTANGQAATGLRGFIVGKDALDIEVCQRFTVERLSIVLQ